MKLYKDEKMVVKTVKVNFILNILRVIIGGLGTLLITPYISRVLGVINLGKIEYVNSIISYFVLFTTLGIPSYGIREIAKVRDNKEKLSQTVVELLKILFVTTLTGYVILFILVFTNKNLFEIKDVIFIMAGNILNMNFGIEWFYQGIENQLYITKRHILIKILTIILVFLLVKKSEDYLIYGGILVLLQGVVSILNLINLKNYINFKKNSLNSLKKHIKPIITISTAAVATSIYTQLDSIMLGNISKEAVGLYIVPSKFIKAILYIVIVMSSLLLPRISNCLKNNDYITYRKYIKISLNYIFLISIPLCIVCILLSDSLIFIMAGNEFRNSILVLKILSPILFSVGVANFIGFQILYPLGLEKYYTISIIVAAIINFLFNYLMIPRYLQNGAAMGTLIAETVGPVVMIILARKEIKKFKDIFTFDLLKYFIASFVMGITIIFIKNYEINFLKVLIYSFIFGSLTYLISLIFLKEDFCMEGIKILKKVLGEYRNS